MESETRKQNPPKEEEEEDEKRRAGKEIKIRPSALRFIVIRKIHRESAGMCQPRNNTRSRRRRRRTYGSQNVGTQQPSSESLGFFFISPSRHVQKGRDGGRELRDATVAHILAY